MRSLLLGTTIWLALLSGCSSPSETAGQADAAAPVVSPPLTAVSAAPVTSAAPACTLGVKYRTGERESWKIPQTFVSLRPDGKELLTGCKGGAGPCVNKLEVWSLETGERRAEASAATAIDPAASLVWAGWSADGGALVTTHHSAVAVRDAATLAVRAELRAAGVTLSPTGKRAIVADRDGIAMLVDVATGQVLTKKKVGGQTGAPPAVWWVPHGESVLLGDGAIELWDAATGADKKSPFTPPPRTPKSPDLGGPAIAISTDGAFVVLASTGGRVGVHDARTGKLERELREAGAGPAGEPIYSNQTKLALSPDGKTLAMTYDKTLELWDLSAGARKATLPAFVGTVWLATKGIEFSPSGKHLAWADQDGVVRVLDVDATQVRTFLGVDVQKHHLDQLAWSDDGLELYLFAACGFIRRAQGWVLATGAARAVDGFSSADPCRSFGADRRFSTVEELNVFQLTRAFDGQTLHVPKSVASASPLGVVLLRSANEFDGPPAAAEVALGCETGPGGNTRAASEVDLAPLRRPGLLRAFITGAPLPGP